ncbi:polyketide synthase [Stieleria sp. ICT_E10.1]|uniref:polyketide synthase n=1 Tax=Stieleria sedimenti TaxID=2976331 RepID=UPI00217FE8F6|nr:polyketide synthase [Stieleria sedimenti]MCS7468157.1 polyketide synthase [Stieleria sedimenti]
MLDPELQSLLQSLRGRIRRYVVWDSVLAIIAVVLVAFWIGLLIDYVPVTLGGTEMPRSARGILLAAVGFAVFVIVVRMLIDRLSRPLPDDSLALLVERHHPQLAGRLVTAVQLSRPGRTGDSHSPDLLRLVHREASESVDEVDPGRVFRMQPLIQKAALAGPLLLLALMFAAYSPSAFARAAARLTLLSDARWPRRARLEMVGVDLPTVSASNIQDSDPQRIEFENGVMRLPTGSSGILRIRAAAEDAEVPSACTVYYETDDGTRGQSNMRRVGRQRDGYQAFVLDGPPLSNLASSFSFSIQGLDDRLINYRIEAAEPPAISAMNVKIRYPDYLRDSATSTAIDESEFDFETPYQAGLRISEGSGVTLEAVSSLPLGDVDVVLESDGQETRVTDLVYADDRRSVQLNLDTFNNPTAIRIVPSDPDGISAQAPFRYFLGAILDEPPSVSLALNGIQSAVTPIARLPLQCVAEDDYGVVSVTAFVAQNASANEGADDGAAAAPESAEPISQRLELDRDGQAGAVIDLRELTNSGQIPALQPGGAISVYAEARDGYNLDGTHLTTSEIFRLQVVTPEELLSLMERRELGLRTRLEQTVTETQGLREQLAGFRSDRFELLMERQQGESEQQTRQRELRIIGLRVQQSGLQASKTAEELTGIAESLDDLLLEMVNNRVDSKDRQERLGSGVRDPLRQIVDVSMEQLKQQIRAIEDSIEQPEQALEQTEAAIQTADQVLLELTAVLEKMLDLESYNELLDLVRGLIQDQEQLKEDTQQERKNRVKDLFK